MNRRDFLAATAAAGVAPLGSLSSLDASLGAAQTAEGEYYELRRYHLLYGEKQQQFNQFLSEAAIPAMNRLGVGPVGAFTVMYGANDPSLYLLLVHKDLASIATLRRRMAADEQFQRAGADVINAPFSDPAFVRLETTLLKAFDGMPKLAVPAGAASGEARIFEMRTYESHSDAYALRKIEMFNKGGEIDIFKKSGMNPVFFSERLAGEKMPCLTYMLSYPDMAGRDAGWARFTSDPAWHELSANPYYANTVSSVNDIILRPTRYSQI